MLIHHITKRSFPRIIPRSLSSPLIRHPNYSTQSTPATASTPATKQKLAQLNIESYRKQIQDRIAKIPIENYRNFSIVAHVDHGKSTLSDRLLELTGVIQPGGNAQVLDKLDVERERGITVKAQTVSMIYQDPTSKEDYLLHLVDTPGHVDFRAEVSRSYASCGGALLLVDATQGVQAQTVANFYLAYSMGLKLIPIINKIDLDSADIPAAMDQVESTFELPREECIPVSAKTGLNVQDIIPAIIRDIPCPTGDLSKPLRALLVDSWHDTYMGVVMLVHIVDGRLKKGSKIGSAHSGKTYDIKELGIMYPDRIPMDELKAGQVGYVIPGMKNPREALVGDTLFQHGKQSLGLEALPGFEEPKPMVFVGAFPADGKEFKAMDDQMENLVLNDRSVHLEKESSDALGMGWRLGFLGSLHASVFKERLEKEYGAKIILTAPTVPFKVVYKNGDEVIIKNPNQFPEHNKQMVKTLMEPYVEAIMTVPDEYVGQVMSLCLGNRGIQKDLEYLTTGQVLLKYEIPMSQLVEDFFGKLKGATKGYASLDYEECGYKEADIGKLQICVNGIPQDALTTIVHRSQAQQKGRESVVKFKKYLKGQLFEIAIQAKFNNKSVARETIKARRKDVTQKLHAADISRYRKLLDRQKEGKKQMKATSSVSIGTDAYQAFLRKED
ncbi:GUF1 [[Candida] subhashii]|uniref:GUF1 n=1 Tax=[Candida] subhashii TaxID=561895 RepID=A0A8J5UU34_9ASCO|nr:GUF1 [[Candida] subhashii]KAG7661355.1 GUF1 [[Candida] subhashii]